MPPSTRRIFALALASMMLAACARDTTTELASLCPDLSPQMREALSTDEAIDALIRRVSAQPVVGAWWRIVVALDRAETDSEYESTRRSITPYLDRIARTMATRYDCDYWSREIVRLGRTDFARWRARCQPPPRTKRSRP